MTKKQITKLFQHWNRVLAAEDLKPLDNSCGMLNDRGSGVIKTTTRGLNRQAAYADIQNRESLVDVCISTFERRVMRLYADGHGGRTIAKHLKKGHQVIRTVIRNVKERAASVPVDIAELVRQCDPGFVKQLQTHLDPDNPCFEDLPDYIQNILQPPLSTWQQQMTYHE